MSEWISVTEKLPEDGEDVLISVKKEIRAFDTSGYIAIASHETRQGRYVWEIEYSNWEKWLDDDDVIAWMPLPKPYEVY